MDAILTLMQELGYIEQKPTGFADLSFLEAVTTGGGEPEAEQAPLVKVP
jgi:hypothetical protein